MSKQRKVVNEFRLKINGEWYYSVLYDDNTVERTKLNNGKVSNKSESTKIVQ